MIGEVCTLWLPDEQIDGALSFRIGVIAPEGVLRGTVHIRGGDDPNGRFERISSQGFFEGPGEHQFVLALLVLKKCPRYLQPRLRVTYDDAYTARALGGMTVTS